VTASKIAPNLELLKTTIKMATNLFEDFDPVSSSNGNKKIQFELKGADYNETLIWNSQKTLR
jgi:methylmalonyl-CoA mutase